MTISNPNGGTGGEKLAVLLAANVSLSGITAIAKAITPVLTTLAVLVQIAVGVFTLVHLIQKYRRKHEKVPGPSTERNPSDGLREFDS
jgi:hypothetical protein